MKNFAAKIKHVLYLTGVISIITMVTAVAMARYFTPDRYQVIAGNKLAWNSGAISAHFDNKEVQALSPAEANQSYRAKLLLFNAIPVKTVYVDVVDESSVLLCGTPFGIKVFTNGVMVVGMADIQTEDRTSNPALSAGLKVGDIITHINGNKVNQNEEIAAEVSKNRGKSLRITYKRGNSVCNTNLQPALSSLDATYKVGLWVRDSTAGIGTLTFFNPTNQSFAGLGHGICDTDTNELMPLLNGDIVPVAINGVVKGQRGTPGELRGYFSTKVPMGKLEKNVQQGVYGVFTNTAPIQQFSQKPVHVAMKQDIKTGPAQILTTLDGGKPVYYDVMIENLNYHTNSSSKDMVVRVTDKKLLSATGGIVQGMSGSPIVQNGKLIGAVTHVFVNDPTCGYGIYAENMLNISKKIDKTPDEKAS